MELSRPARLAPANFVAGSGLIWAARVDTLQDFLLWCQEPRPVLRHRLRLE